MREAARARPASPGYQLFMLALCVFALASLAARSTVALAPETGTVLEYADLAICAFFFADFLICLWRAPNRTRYFFSWGWLDLVSSIPSVDVARWGRAARVLRIVRVLRGLRATKLIAQLILERRAESTFLAVSLVALLLIVVSSISVLHFEAGADGNIKTAEDAVWWAFTTITTVGYGDRFPLTTEGRFVATTLMCAGVGLFGTFSGFLAAWFLAPAAAEEGSELRDLRDEVAALRASVDALRKDQGS